MQTVLSSLQSIVCNLGRLAHSYSTMHSVLKARLTMYMGEALSRRFMRRINKMAVYERNQWSETVLYRVT